MLLNQFLLLSAFLFCTGAYGVIATVERVELRDDGHIASVVTRDHGAMTADLYVDCTGFRAALIGGALGAPCKPLSDVQTKKDHTFPLRIGNIQDDAKLIESEGTLTCRRGFVEVDLLNLLGRLGLLCRLRFDSSRLTRSADEQHSRDKRGHRAAAI